MSRAVALHIPQPCFESWDAMTPASAGRHCAACQKTVVDFTLQSDAEILAYLAKAAAGRTCGRFAAGQLERPLQRAVSAAPTGRWRAWLAAAVAVWAVREGVSVAANAQAPSERRTRYWGGPVPAVAPVAPANTRAAEVATPLQNQVVMGGLPLHANPASEHPDPFVAPAPVLRGIVTDYSTNEKLPGVTILVNGTTITTSSNADGVFEVAVPLPLWSAGEALIVAQCIGFERQQRIVSTRSVGTLQAFNLQTSTMGVLSAPRSWPWHPRRFYYWGKYWLTRPFHRL